MTGQVGFDAELSIFETSYLLAVIYLYNIPEAFTTVGKTLCLDLKIYWRRIIDNVVLWCCFDNINNYNSAFSKL